jgi:hypothetical protein
MRKASIICIAALVILTLCACNNKGNLTIDAPNEEEKFSDGYPVFNKPTEDITTGYPITNVYTPAVVPDITPSETTGVVRGTILHKGKPVIGYNLYLADIAVDDQGNETTALLRRSEAPQTILGVGGEFIFSDVIPDRYALMLYNGVGAVLLLKPDQVVEEAIIVDVLPGETINLGILDFQELPVSTP